MNAKGWFITVVIFSVAILAFGVIAYNEKVEREKEIAGPHYP